MGCIVSSDQVVVTKTASHPAASSAGAATTSPAAATSAPAPAAAPAAAPRPVDPAPAPAPAKSNADAGSNGAAVAAASTVSSSDTDALSDRAALDVPFEKSDPNAKENEAKEDAAGSDIDDHIEYGRQRAVFPNDVINAGELKDVGLRAAGDNKSPNANPLFETEDAASGAQFGAVRPWLGALKAPSKTGELNSKAPTQSLSIDWVYGYRGYDSRANVFCNSEGHVVYPTAALVVKLDTVNRKQSYFHGHNDDVVCLAQCPTNPDLFASGQVATIIDRRATPPHICVFNGKTMQPILTIKKAHQRAVRAVGISTAGKYLASVGDDNEQTVCVWDMKTGNKLGSASGDRDPQKIFGVSWKNDNEFVTVGVKHIFFWTFNPATGELKKKKGKCAGKFEMQTFFTATWTPKGYCAAATRDGGVYIFRDGEAAYAAVGHKGAVYMVLCTAKGLLTGGRDGSVILWDNSMKKVQNWNFEAPIRAIGVFKERMVVGTEHSELFEVPNYTVAAGAAQPTLLFRGHWDGELWAVDAEPNGQGFATVCEDNKLIVWDHIEHRLNASNIITDKQGKQRKRERAATTSSHPANACARAIRYNSDGSHVAIGTNDGELSVYETKQLTRIAYYDLNKYAKQNIAKKWGNWIQTLKYSPDGKYLAVGTHGSVIIICDVNSNYAPIDLNSKHKSLDGHNSALIQVDWSKDSKHMRSNCRAYELLFWNIASPIGDSKQEGSATAMRDVEWADPSCIFSWGTMGIFDPSQTGTDINAVDVHPTGTICATADDYGRVNLFRYPVIPPANHSAMPTNRAPAQQCEKKTFAAHSSHVQNVRWSPDGQYLFSVGGNDKTIIQWKLTN